MSASGQGTVDGVPSTVKIYLSLCGDGTALVEAFTIAWARGRATHRRIGVYRVGLDRMALAGLPTSRVVAALALAPIVPLEQVQEPPQQVPGQERLPSL